MSEVRSGVAVVAAALCFMAAPTPVQAGDRAEEVFEKTYPLAATGRVSLGNVNGQVDIRVWDRAEVDLKAVKSAETKEQLSAVTIKVEASPDGVKVETKYPKGKWRWKKDSARVDYTLKVPAGVRLDEVNTVNGNVTIEGVRGMVEASTVNGRVVATGLAADADVSTVNGSAEVGFASLADVKHVKVDSVNGSITLTLPHEAEAHLDLSTVNEGIANEFNLPVQKDGPVGRHLRATLGQGGPRVKASTVNGSIRVKRGPAD